MYGGQMGSMYVINLENIHQESELIQKKFFKFQEEAIQVVEHRKKLLAKEEEEEEKGNKPDNSSVSESNTAENKKDEEDVEMYDENDDGATDESGDNYIITSLNFLEWERRIHNYNSMGPNEQSDAKGSIELYSAMPLSEMGYYTAIITPATREELEAKKNEQIENIYGNNGNGGIVSPQSSFSAEPMEAQSLSGMSVADDGTMSRQKKNYLPQSFAEKTREMIMRERERDNRKILVLRPVIETGMRFAIDQNPKPEPFVFHDIKDEVEEDDEDGNDDDINGSDVIRSGGDVSDDVGGGSGSGSSKILTKQNVSTENRKRKQHPWEENPESAKSYFNYGFNGDTWKLYMQKQKKLKRLLSFTDSIDVFDGLSTFSQVSVVRGYRLLSELMNVSQMATAMDTPADALDDVPQIILDNEIEDTREIKMPLRKIRAVSNEGGISTQTMNVEDKKEDVNKNDKKNVDIKNADKKNVTSVAPDTPPMSPPSSPEPMQTQHHRHQHHHSSSRRSKHSRR